jgi:hypothetical protein
MGRASTCRADDRADKRLGAGAKQRHEANPVMVSDSPLLRGEADGKERGQGARKGRGRMWRTLLCRAMTPDRQQHFFNSPEPLLKCRIPQKTT